MLNELFRFSRLAEHIVNADEFHRGRRFAGKKLCDDAAQAARYLMFFDGNDRSGFTRSCDDCFFVKRLYRMYVHDDDPH